MLANTTDRQERIVLLQHAIDNITSTFYTQVLFADFELAAHERVERDEPITAEVLNDLYKERFEAYYADSVDVEDLTPITWARIPHFFNTPYYVYQYATCFASAAKLAGEISEGSERSRTEARARYLDLLASGGSDHPMTLLKKAGVDLSEPSTIQAVIDQLDKLVGRLEELV
jgi:oligoendopeptidase F